MSVHPAPTYPTPTPRSAMPSPRLPRRKFLQTGLGGILAAAAAPRIVPSTLLGAHPPSGRLTLGCIGVGAHGLGVNLQSFLHEPESCRVVAVCDVFASRRRKARELVDRTYGTNGCAEYGDFRAVLARPDIDAVVISTPDHWHVPMSKLAIAAGKKVFCEKPTLTIAEGRELADLVASRNAFFATGLEDRAVIQYHKLAEVVRNGGIGELRRIQVQLPTKPVYAREEPAPVPADLHYDLWLGPAPFRPYSPKLTDAQVWRQIRDFSGGSLTDWGAHLVDTAQVANFAELSGPVSIEGRGQIPANSLNSVPHTYQLTYVYANGVTLDVTSGGTGIRCEGTTGWVGNRSFAGKLEASDMEVFRRTYDPATNRIWPRRPREHRDFLESVQNGRPPMYTAEALHRLSSTLHLGAIAMELGRRLKWDPQNEDFVGDPGASALRSRVSRTDWERASA